MLLMIAVQQQMDRVETGASTAADPEPEPPLQQSATSPSTDQQHSTVTQPSDPEPCIVTPEAIRPFPVAARALHDKQSGRKKRKAVVATSSPYKAELEIAEKKKQKKLAPKRLIVGSGDIKTKSRNKASSKQKKQKGAKGVKKITSRAEKRVGKKKMANLDTENLGDAECLICNERYSASASNEQWIMCSRCQGWCHEECTNGETSTGFVCDFCC